ncbi:MAG: hypothetical protein M0Z55_13015 [Peptococcaceae bacterium]|nr:hypothetical protein [Peptococcaceae bacterium]
MNTDKSSLIAKSKQYVQAVLNGEFDTIAANLGIQCTSECGRTGNCRYRRVDSLNLTTGRLMGA